MENSSPATEVSASTLCQILAWSNCRVVILPLLAGIIGCNGSANIREFTTQEGITFVGKLDATNGKAEYFGVRFHVNPNSDSPNLRKLSLHVNGKDFEILAVTPADILACGGNLVATPKGAEEEDTTFGYLAWGEQNRDGSIELKFKNKLVEEGSLHWHAAGPSPFLLSWDSNKPIAFPASEEEVRKEFGPPVKVRDFFAK
jgi:hypothetical protein